MLNATYSYAIKGAPNQKLLLEDIYYAIESRVSCNAKMLECIVLIYNHSFLTSGQHLPAGRYVKFP